MLLCYSLSLFLFFFFKPKTAYEMRISDWSSDVCSSDLPTDHGGRLEAAALAAAARRRLHRSASGRAYKHRRSRRRCGFVSRLLPSRLPGDHWQDAPSVDQDRKSVV